MNTQPTSCLAIFAALLHLGAVIGFQTDYTAAALVVALALTNTKQGPKGSQ